VSEGYAAVHSLPEGTTEITHSEWRARVHPEDLNRVEAVHDQAVAEKRREYSVEYRIVRSDGEVRWTERRCLISYDDNARPQRVVGVSIDVTERKRAEERQRVLAAELDHRVKNALATVSSVVSQTAVESGSVANFVTALDGRIRSMATTHELLSSTRWRGIALIELIRRELMPYATTSNTDISGPEIVLRAEAGQALAMVLHELATNAAKHGALSNSNGRVSIHWRRAIHGQPQAALVLKWQEMGGPPVVATGKPSYGTSTICDLIPYEFGGKVDLVFAPDGVRCDLELPAAWLSGDPVSRTIIHNNQGINGAEHAVLARSDAKSGCNEKKEPRSDPIACGLRRVRRRHRAFAKGASNYRKTKPVSWASGPELREHIESALRAVGSHIVKGEHRLIQHGKLLEKLKGRSGLVIAHQLQLNLETGLHLMRSIRVRLLKELEQNRVIRVP